MAIHVTARLSGAPRAHACLLRRSLVALALGAACGAASADARAQARTFYLDRLPVAGAPDDGIALWRPEMGERTRFFGQLGIGLSVEPFRVEDEIRAAGRRATVERDLGQPVDLQVIEYADVGVEIRHRVALEAMLPVTVFERGSPTNEAGVAPTAVDLRPAAPMDLRLGARALVYENASRSVALGVDGAVWLPTGDAYSYGGDGSPSGSIGAALEVDLRRAFVVLDTSVHFRPAGAVNDFRVGDEWCYGLGAFVPLRGGALRLGAELFGSTGITGATAFTAANTPL
ncbi:MAG TPA: cell envelope biogenesis protein OmpA, partial [Minicystis sp.]|nr:cell envelope biogenesis protein OmpA [Minicystis sp.]